ncbi:histone H2A-Bbd type 1 [Sciurus carolinensis]|uniref:histone H2A-Bbd type 1 n=1 Tax=Sciurus carolinensis TaxID=30640 RepID=UPI001FB503AC|nr:histone H2A-Bbd type 1 [Sciurus carolinensis]
MAGKKYRRNYTSKKQTISRSTRAELQFPVDRFLRQGPYAERLNSFTPVFLAGVVEYLTTHILDLAGQEAHSNCRMRITPEHVKKVLEKNHQFHRLFQENSKSPDAEKPNKNDNRETQRKHGDCDQHGIILIQQPAKCPFHMCKETYTQEEKGVL